MTSELNYILSFQLATNEDLLKNYDQIKHRLDSTSPNSIQLAIQHHGTTSPTIHRWSLRLLSLLDPKLPSAILSRAYSLLLTTFQSSPYLLIKHTPTILQPTLNILYKPRPDRELYEAALDVVLLVLARGQEKPEWLRELVGAQGQNNGVQRVVKELVKKLQDDTLEELHPSSLTALNILLPLFPTQLRPLSPLLHTLTISLLCLPPSSSSSPALSENAAQLYANLYLLAPKGKDGLRESWKLSVESLVGSIWECEKVVTQGVFTEDLSLPPPPPLSLPPLTPSTPTTALHRLTTLSSALLTLLRTPTTPLAGSVPIPLSHLLNLSLHLLSLTPESPLKLPSTHTTTTTKTDENTLRGIFTHLPNLNLIATSILLQLAYLLPPPILSRHSPLIFSSLQRTLETPSVDKSTKSVLRRCWAELGRCLGGCIGGGEGEGKALGRVWRGVLEDLGRVWSRGVGEEEVDKDEKGNGNGIGEDEESKRKKKRQKTFDPDAGSNGAGSGYATARLSSGDLDLVLRALETLEILLSLPLSHFLPPKLHQATLHLLLSISLSPTFSSSHTSTTSPTPTTLLPLFTKSPTPLSLFSSQPSFRLLLLRTLLTLSKSDSLATGSEEFLQQIWSNASRDTSSAEVRAIALEGMGEGRRKVRPVMPGVGRNLRLIKERNERTGGELGGMEEVLEEGQRWGGTTEMEKEKVEDGDEEMDDAGREEKKEEVVRTFKDVPPAVSSTAGTTSTPTSGFGAAFAAFSSSKPTPKIQEEVAPPPPRMETQLDVTVAVASGSKTPNALEKKNDRGEEEEDSSDEDDEELPQILMDSDDDE